MRVHKKKIKIPLEAALTFISLRDNKSLTISTFSFEIAIQIGAELNCYLNFINFILF